MDSSDQAIDGEYDYEDSVLYSDGIPDCGNDTNMNLTTRFAAYETHISLRLQLANGKVKNGKNPEGGNFATASDMSMQTYDCGLERAAFNISSMCQGRSSYDFSNVGINIATYDNAADGDDILRIMHGLMGLWWNTSMQGFPLVNLTPTESDTGMIPFLQMANANTTKIGCAYSVCNSNRDRCNLSPSSIVFVCAYGTPRIQLNNPIYTEGEPCDTCNDTCAYKSFCNRTASELKC
ncbi:hypothetical protein KIN20_032959 [Parelaphostrongylus tenuis]|uniref:SCP domain-containing protein n=1 Tax=Parelaphostrongylus tenuis TaxID=148309 RepID=A0AAD5R9K2_PARTN|nr:hypothetical protein KIN20_032959 [Parelaphostrongylus tenuis]